MLRRCLTVALAGVFLCVAAPPSRAQAAAIAPAAPAAADEISMTGLGLGTQAVYGPSPSLDVRFPPPAQALSGSGNYLRIFFDHSPLAGSGSTVKVLVNGRLLDVVALTASTAPGSVFVLQVPTLELNSDAPNMVEFAFSLVARTPVDSAALYGRVGAETALHYQLAADPGTIESYPYSLGGGSLFGSLAAVPLSVVVPTAPDDAELSATFRLVADTSRRLRGSRVVTSLVSRGQETWLQTAHAPALMVGRFADLPGSASLLQAAGFTASTAGWIAPNASAPVSAHDGIIAAVLSPWDGRSPMLLVTGASDEGVARAAAAVADSRQGVTGHAAVVSGSSSTAGGTAPDVPFRTLLPEELALHGVGDHVVALGIPAPAAGVPFPSAVRLTLTIAGSPAGQVDSLPVILRVDGQGVGVPPIFVGKSVVVTRDLAISDALRPGINGVTVNVRITAADLREVGVTTDLSNPRPLVAASATSTLEELPHPFLEASGGISTVAVADAQPTTLGGAVAALAALGSRSVVPTAPVAAVVLGRGDQVPSTAGSVVVVGGPVADSLRLHSGAFRTTVIAPPADGTGGRAGWITESNLPGGSAALWIGGDPNLLAATGTALADVHLRGRVAVIGPGGQALRVLTAAPETAPEPVSIRLAYLLPLAVGIVLLGLMALEGRRRWRGQR